MEDQRINCIRNRPHGKRLPQMAVHGEESPGIPKNMIGHVLIRRNNVDQDRPFQNASPIVPESNDDDCILMAAQRLGTPVLSGAAVIAVEKLIFPETWS